VGELGPHLDAEWSVGVDCSTPGNVDLRAAGSDTASAIAAVEPDGRAYNSIRARLAIGYTQHAVAGARGAKAAGIGVTSESGRWAGFVETPIPKRRGDVAQNGGGIIRPQHRSACKQRGCGGQ